MDTLGSGCCMCCASRSPKGQRQVAYRTLPTRSIHVHCMTYMHVMKSSACFTHCKTSKRAFIHSYRPHDHTTNASNLCAPRALPMRPFQTPYGVISLSYALRKVRTCLICSHRPNNQSMHVSDLLGKSPSIQSTPDAEYLYFVRSVASG